MTISSIKGMSVNTPLRRTDVVLPERPPVSELTTRFRVRLENAGGGYRGRPAASLDRHVKSGLPDSSRPAPQARRNGSAPMPAPGHDIVRTAASAMHEQSVSPSILAVLRCAPRIGKRPPRDVRKTVRKLASGLTVVDVRSDPAEKAVTLLVEQDGWEDAEITIRHEESGWSLLVRTATVQEAEGFRQGRRSLQRRFDEAKLGRVSLSCIGEDT